MLPSGRSRRSRLPEWPTLGIALAVHGGWLALTAASASLPWWLLAPLGGFLVAWHGSFQHETIHGHPTRSRALNAAMGSLPLALWMPYGIYRAQHLAHHGVDELTDPVEDPESFYVSAERWSASSRVWRGLLRMQMTLLGRLVLGPPMVIGGFLVAELRRLASGDRRYLRAWALHLVGVGLVFAWLLLVCHMSVARYLLCFVYPGVALGLLRSFAEHRPAALHAQRVCIVEAGPLASLLYLNNNLHVLHHDAPAVPWYELPARYEATRAKVLADNGDFFFEGYLALFARYALRSKDSPVHPSR